MINLLSSEHKQELKAARQNIILRKYAFTTIFLMIVIAASYGVGYGMMMAQEAGYKVQIAEYAPQREQYKDTIKQASEYNKNLSIAKSILSSELSYSSFMTTIAKTLPPTTNLLSIRISTSDLEKPFELNFASSSASDNLATKEALEKSPYFSNVMIRSTNTLPQGTYPHQFNVIVTFDRTAFMSAQREGILR